MESGSACTCATFDKKMLQSTACWFLTFVCGSARHTLDKLVLWISISRRTVDDLAQPYYVKIPHARRTLANSFLWESPRHENGLPVETKRSYFRALKVSNKFATEAYFR